MTYSLNEIEAISKKAARGAGFSWGMSEEAGKAVRWLVAYGFAGAEAFADLLETSNGLSRADFAPREVSHMMAPADGPMCPIACGAVLCDAAARLTRDGGTAMLRVAHPLLVVPFAAAAAGILRKPVTIGWGDLAIVVDASDVWVSDPQDELNAPWVDRIDYQRGGQADGTPKRPSFRGTVSPEAQATLAKFAHRTYAPATEESRMFGAGAGIADND